MVATIFYPIFTLKSPFSSVLYKKKQKQKQKNPRPSLHQVISLDPLVGLQLPPYPQLQKTGCAHIFSGLSTDML